MQKKRRESPQSVSNGWCNSISSVGKEKNHSELCSGFTSRTFLSLAGRRSHRCCSDAVSYIHTSTTWCGLTHRQPSEGFTGGPDPAAAAASASASASVPSLPPRCWRRKWPLGPKHKCAQTPNSCGATERTHEGIRYQEVCGGNSSWWLCRWSEAQVFFFSVSFLSLPPFGSVRTEAPCGEQERPHVEGNTRRRADRQDALSQSQVWHHSGGKWCSTKLVVFLPLIPPKQQLSGENLWWKHLTRG